MLQNMTIRLIYVNESETLYVMGSQSEVIWGHLAQKVISLKMLRPFCIG